MKKRKKRISPKKRERRRRFKFMLLGGVFDTLATVGSFLLILVFLTVLGSLVGWLRQDIVQTFSSIQNSISTAIVSSVDD